MTGLSFTQLYAQESHINLTLDSFDVDHSGKAMGQIEHVFSKEWFGIRAHIGLFVSKDSAAYLYG